MFSAYSTFVIYLVIDTCFFVYTEFFQGVYFPFIRSVYYVHDVSYGANIMFIAQKMLCKFGCCSRICNHGSAPGTVSETVYLSALYNSYCSQAMLVGIRRIFHIFLFDGCFVEKKVYLEFF